MTVTDLTVTVGMVTVMVDMAETAKPNFRPLPIYATYSIYERVMDQFQRDGLPKAIDVKAVTAVPVDPARRLIAGFRAMGWIDDAGVPNAELRALVKARNTPDWQQTLLAALRNAYSFLPTDWEQLTSAQLTGAFREHTGRDDDALKSAQTFFLAAAIDAGVPLPSALAIRASKTRRDWSTNFKFKGDRESVKETKQKIPAVRRNGAAEPHTDADVAQVWNLLALLDNADVRDEEKDAILTLLAYLKRRSERRREGDRT